MRQHCLALPGLFLVLSSGCSSNESETPWVPRDAAADSAEAGLQETGGEASTADAGMDSEIPEDASGDGPGTPEASADSAVDSSLDAPFDVVAETALPLIGAWPQSSYSSLPTDVTVSADTALLTISFDLPEAAWVLVHSDGRFGPAGGSGANVHIEVDGQKASNDSYIDWSKSTNAQQHCFNALGAVSLGAGHHEVKLVADEVAGSFFVGAGSNLVVMVHPADQVDSLSLAQDSQSFDYTTLGKDPGIPTPHDPLLSTSVSPASAEDVVALASARAYHAGTGAGTYGDAMLGVYLDGKNPGNDRSTWTVNDIWTGAETQAPMFAHAFFPALDGVHVISLDASEFPWGGQEDSVIYKVGAGSRLVVLRGSLAVRGSAPISQALDNTVDYVGIGTDENWPGVPPVGTDVVVASASFVVPAGHSGVVMFLTRNRVQGDQADAGGTVSLRLSLDGKPVGNVGIQQLKAPDSVSQRTVGASYLATGLSQGQHTIEAIARVEGSFKHLAMNKDLPLVWFD